MRTTRRRFLLAGGGTAIGAGVIGAGSLRGGESGAGGGTDGAKPSALVAGSLQSLAEDVPGAQVEAHGSLTVRHYVRDGFRDPDVVAMADPTLFEGIADEVRLFATNALALAYDPDADAASAIREDWATALQERDLTIGRTDPETDPLGYRTVLALRLAARAGRIERPAAVLRKAMILPEVQLGRALGTGGLDAAFVYRNMAAEYDLPAIDLPARFDFSDPALAETYASVSLELDDRTVRGAPIRYGAAALTARGRDWFERLTTDTARLRRHGFTVPDGYPEPSTVS
ncbi:MAG: substrate-binding domain-containing protein [Haloglomus sp.]